MKDRSQFDSSEGTWTRSMAAGRPSTAWAVALLAITLPAAGSAQTPRPPNDLIQKVAANGTLFQRELGNYTYRQTFEFLELDARGAARGRYKEVRDVLLTPEGERTEEFIGKPAERLQLMRLTEEDFRDIRDVQPFVLTEENLWNYETAYKGVESVDGEFCYVFRLRPRQVLDGQRLLDGLIWISQKHLQPVRVSGEPVPQIYRESGDNLFPRFTTLYHAVDGKFWFPVRTFADDVLNFRTGPQHVRYTIDFGNYKRFRSDSTIQFQR